MNHKQLIFDYIHSIGAIENHKDNMYIFDITSAYGKSEGEVLYLVFLKGGISFEISREKEQNGGYTHTYAHVWEGSFSIITAEECAAYLKYLGHV